LIEVYKKHEIQKIQNVWEEVNRRARKIWEIQNFQNALKESDAKVKKFIKDIKSHSKAGINGTYESIEQKVETLVEKTKTQVNHGKEKFQNDAQSVIDTMNKVPEFYSKAKNNIGNCVGKECEKLTKLKFW
jgi:archaellum component FlaC